MTTRPVLFVLAFLLGDTYAAAQEAATKRTYEYGKPILKLEAEAAANYSGSSSRSLPETRFSKIDASAKSFDWSKRIAGAPILRQSGSRTCWAFASTAALEWNWAIRNTPGNLPRLSPQPIIDRVGVNAGHPISDALELLLHFGTALEADYPTTGKPAALRSVRTPYRIVGWGKAAEDNRPTPEQIKEALVKHGPLVCSVYATPAFHKYKGGVFGEFAAAPADHPTSHYVLIVGWDDARGKKGAWRVQNSWGAKWGDHGFMWIEYGCNNIGLNARWLRAQSIFYALPADAHKKLKEGDRFPTWSMAEAAAQAARSEMAAAASSPAEDSAGDEPIAPSAAKDRVGDRVWVRFNVGGTATSGKGHCDLYSTKSWRDPDCLVVRIPCDAFPAFKAADARELRDRFRGKTILVEGKVEKTATKEGDRLLIVVSNPKSLTSPADEG